MSETVRPIIIRRKKVYAADGHHGGAWKVAYADFVTAMMAFFLLMWLLNATTEEQRKGIADFFSPNIPLAAVSGGGPDALNGDSIFTQSTLSRSGTGVRSEEGYKAANAETQREIEEPDTNLQARVESLNESLKSKDDELIEHIRFKASQDGLVIELIDTDDQPLFSIGNATPSNLLKELLEVVGASFGTIQNDVKIVGHTDGRQFSKNADYSNWELSTDRANTSRRLLIEYGFPAQQISEVSGKAFTDPISENLFAAQNRRISITLLNHH